nr:MAG TPA: hypothetical protein [Caudoviricetes sp.]
MVQTLCPSPMAGALADAESSGTVQGIVQGLRMPRCSLMGEVKFFRVNLSKDYTE